MANENRPAGGRPGWGAGRGALAAIGLLGLALPVGPALAADTVPIPAGSPGYFKSTLPNLLGAPLPLAVERRQGPLPANVAAGLAVAGDPHGRLGTLNQGRATPTDPDSPATNAFFRSLGGNGRTCATCHVPAQAMGLTAASARRTFEQTGGRDPLFAPVDGMDCPNKAPAAETRESPRFGRKGRGRDGGRDGLKEASSLLLKDGLIRVALPIAPGADFTVKIIGDPTTCNSDPEYNSDNGSPPVPVYSVHRRPLISANLDFATVAIGASGKPRAPGQDAFASGNIMWDGREPTLESQARNATFGHAQRDPAKPMSAKDVAEIVAFEKGFFVAQAFDKEAGDLTANGGRGGPRILAANVKSAGVIPDFSKPLRPFDEFTDFGTAAGGGRGAAAAAEQASIRRGQEVFNARQFQVANVAGFNDFPGVANPTTGTCATCHHMSHGGGDALPDNQRNIGTAGDAAVFRGSAPRRDLTRFEVTCKPGATRAFGRAKVVTNDLGLAFITGKCADVGKFKVPSLRGLDAHAPYFHDGSADTLADVVDFYDRRFSMGLTRQERADLVAFLEAL